MRIVSLAFIGIAMMAGAASAQTAAAPGVESTTVTETRIVCVRQDAPTGSHMGAKKLCHTDAEWKQIHAQSQYDMNNMQDRSNNSFQGAALANGG